MKNNEKTRRKIILAATIGLIFSTLLVSFIALLKSKCTKELPYPPDTYMIGTPYEELPRDCNAGQAVEGSVPVEDYCYRPFQDSILERAETSTGMLLVKRDQSLWLDYEKLADAEWIVIQQGFPEKNSIASLFIVNISPIPYSSAIEDEDTGNRFNHLYLHIVDVGVTPPFISKERLPITGERDKNGDRGLLAVKKIDENTYILSGETLPEKGTQRKPAKLSVKYNRKDRTVTRIK